MNAQMKILSAVQKLSQRLEAIERALDANGTRMVGSAEAAEMLGISVSAGSMSAAIEVMIWWYGFAGALRGMAYIGAKHEEEVNYKEWKESTKKQ